MSTACAVSKIGACGLAGIVGEAGATCGTGGGSCGATGPVGGMALAGDPKGVPICSPWSKPWSKPCTRLVGVNGGAPPMAAIGGADGKGPDVRPDLGRDGAPVLGIGGDGGPPKPATVAPPSRGIWVMFNPASRKTGPCNGGLFGIWTPLKPASRTADDCGEGADPLVSGTCDWLRPRFVVEGFSFESPGPPPCRKLPRGCVWAPPAEFKVFSTCVRTESGLGEPNDLERSVPWFCANCRADNGIPLLSSTF